MITNKDIRVENGFLIINGDKYPLDGQSPETIMEIVEANSDTTPTENSTAPVTSGGVYTALGAKQDTLTFDTTPTDESTNPVTSGGVYTAIGAVDIKIGDLTQTGITGADVAAQLGELDNTLDTIHPSADRVSADVFESNSAADLVIILNETGNDDYKGMIVKDKDGNERYRLYFTGGHIKFLSKAADGTTIVDTTLA